MKKELKSPRLRNVEKANPPYKLNNFPKEFAYKLGQEIIYILATRNKPELEGKDWESTFASCINAEWEPSNVGLDDVVLGNCAWGAKTIKNNKPHSAKKVRLISGRNSPIYSYGTTKIVETNPNELAEQILEIWNERVSSLRNKFRSLRTVVLIKSINLEELTIFEFETVLYDYQNFNWKWNKNNNLEGHSKSSNEHCFTWQPHGSQFTIIENVPKDSLMIKIKKPTALDKTKILEEIGYNKNWVEVITRNG